MSTATIQDESKALAVQELTIRLDSPLASLTPEARHQIETAARAVALSLGVVGISENFEARRDGLIAVADAFTAPPQDDTEQEAMLQAQRDLAKFRTSTTKEVDGYKRPLNDARGKIINLTDTGLRPVEAAEERLQGFINNRQMRLLRERKEAELAAQREQKRIADEAAAAQRAQEAAENARNAAELAAQQAETAKGKAKQKAEDEALRLAAEASRLEEEAFDKSLAAETAPEVVVPVSFLAMAREVKDFTLIGRNDAELKASLTKLLAAHPEFFTIEAKAETPRSYALKLRISDFTDALNGKQPFAKIESAPGINITSKLTTLR